MLPEALPSSALTLDQLLARGAKVRGEKIDGGTPDTTGYHVSRGPVDRCTFLEPRPCVQQLFPSSATQRSEDALPE